MSKEKLGKSGVEHMWAKIKALVTNIKAKDIGALPNTGGTIKGKLSVDVDADGANPELRVAQGRVDILKKDTVTDEAGAVTETNYPLAAYEGDWKAGKIRFRGGQFLISSIVSVVEGKLNLHKSKGIYGKTAIHSNSFRIDQNDDENDNSGVDNGLIFEMAGGHIKLGHAENDCDIDNGIHIGQMNDIHIWSNRINMGHDNDYFLEYDYYINSGGDLKLRGGNNGCNLTIDSGGISMWANGGLTIMNSNGEATEACLLQDNGINAFYGDIGLWGLLFGNPSIHNPANKYQRAIELYKDSNTPVRFYSDGGWAFGSGDADNFAPVFAISPNGQINSESVEISNNEELPITGSMARGKIAFKNSDPPATYPSYNLDLNSIYMDGIEHIKVLSFESVEGGQPDIYILSGFGDVELYIDYLILSSNVNNVTVVFNGMNGKVYIGKKIGEFKVYGAPGVTVYGG